MEKKELPKNLSRRDFIRLGGFSAASLFIPTNILQPTSPEETPHQENWPSIDLESLPQGEIKEVLSSIPDIKIDREGNLTRNGQRLRFVETGWSKENRTPINPDSITIHWSGHQEPKSATSENLLNGYDQERIHRTLGYEYKTSAHATVGPYSLEDKEAKDNDFISITQTQRPENGWPTIASHIRSDLTRERLAFRDAQHPLNSMETLLGFYEIPENYNYLLGVLDTHLGEDINFRTVGFELVGTYFDEEGHPDPQLIANTLGLIFAYKERYPNIKFSNITGHSEIQLDKPDPGKNFMAEIRLLMGLKVLMDGSEEQKSELFGDFMTEANDPIEAIKRYFDFHWDFLNYQHWAHPKKVFRWEEKTNYWEIYNYLFEKKTAPVAKKFKIPVTVKDGLKLVIGNEFATPDYHEGADINVQSQKGGELNEDMGYEVEATASGRVVFKGHIPSSAHEQNLGNTVVLEHTTVDGGKLLSLYAHLEDDISVNEGDEVEMGQKIASMGNSGGQADSHLHFSIFPKSTLRQEEFEMYLQMRYKGDEFDTETKDETGKIFVVPTSTKKHSIHKKYFDPIKFIENYGEVYDRGNNQSSKLERLEDTLR